MKTDTTQCSGCIVRDKAVSRRDFVSAATLSAMAVVLTACGGGSEEGATGPIEPGTGQIAISLANFPELATVGSVARVRITPPVAMARTSTGLVAFSLSCTHQGTTVLIEDDRTLQCPNHGARFTFDGIWVNSSQRTSSLVRLPVAVDAGGTTATVTLG
jgi:Rieske Fe-S protein